METMQITPLKEWLTEADRPVIVSGPCSAETEEQVLATCTQLKATGKVDILRAGIWKPRTRPNNFEGVGAIGLQWLRKARAATGLPIAVEVANTQHVHEALKHGVDILWIGARTTVNPFSVQEIADAIKGIDIPVMIKNPINADIDLWLGAIERIHQAGIDKIVGIHRGFAKYGEKKYRNAPQWQLPIELKRRLPSLPMICDPSHICGNREMLQQVSQEAMDLKYDGLMLESHITPDKALSDAKQQVTPTKLKEIVGNLVLREDSDASDIKNDQLNAYRTQIDSFDGEIMTLLGQRMKVAEDIGKFKKEHNITILQTKRWEQVLEQAYTRGAQQGLSEQFVERFLKAIHQESIDHQHTVMNIDS